jgi:predicted acetyltransferase
MELGFRAATKDDLDRLLEIHLVAYPDPRGVEERKRGFLASPFGPFETAIVVERAGEIVAQAHHFALEAFFGGRAVKMGGIASVAVAPEVRGQGIASALMRHIHVASDVRGEALTLLYAWQNGFYARHGYAQGASRKRLEIDPRAVPEAWREQARGRVRAARGDDRDAMKRAYLRAAARASGWLVRPETLWDRLFSRERRHHLVLPGAEGEVAGYAAFEITQEAYHAETILHVDEIIADDDDARRTLFGALGAMRDQAAEIAFEVDASDPIELALLGVDARRFGTPEIEHPLGTIVGGPMVRIEDIPRAIEARGYLASGSFDVVVEDADLAVHVRVEDGRATVESARGGGALRTTRRGLAAMLYGGLRPIDAVRLGVAGSHDSRALARADAVLVLPPLAPLDPF